MCVTGPALQRLAVARTLFDSAAQQHSKADQIQSELSSRVASLLQKGPEGAAMALELLCLMQLSSNYDILLQRLTSECKAYRQQVPAQSASCGSTCRLPLHFEGSVLARADNNQPRTSMPHKRGRDHPSDETLSEASAAAGQQQVPGSDSKRPRRAECSIANACERHAAEPNRESSNDEAAAAAAATLTVRMLIGHPLSGSSDTGGSDQSAASHAALAVHPALLAEVSRNSFVVGRAYLSVLLSLEDGSLSEGAVVGLMHMLRLGGIPAKLSQAAMLRACDAYG